MINWIEQIKKTNVMSNKRSAYRMNKREVVLDKFLLHWLKEDIGYNLRFRYETARAKPPTNTTSADVKGFTNDYMLSRLVDFLEMKHYGRHITKKEEK
tara:strand:- start:311 stop:604 length:294 start_codon:yes stop_codon:yes gene_type:complete